MFLEIKDLKKSFGTAENRTEVLKGIDFSVEKGQICVLLGPSGSGKSAKVAAQVFFQRSPLAVPQNGNGHPVEPCDPA